MAMTKLASDEGKHKGGTSPTGWTVTVGFDVPDEPNVARHPKFYERLSTLLAARGSAFKQTASHLFVTFGSSEQDYRSARKDADSCVTLLLQAMNLNANQVGHLRLTANQDIEQELAKLPSCVGVGEAADILGVSKQRVTQLAQRTDFPAPLLRLRATPVWRQSDIQRFASTRQTTPGPARRRA